MDRQLGKLGERRNRGEEEKSSIGRRNKDGEREIGTVRDGWREINRGKQR